MKLNSAAWDAMTADSEDDFGNAHEMAQAANVADEQIEELQATIRTMYRNVKNLMTESKMSMIRQDAHNQAVNYNSKQNLYMTIFEALAFIGICAFNLYHIKGILENRRII